MTQINLTTASAQELRQLLDSSRRRGDAALSYKILEEMAARREAPSGRRQKGKHAAQAHSVEVDFGDPAADAVDDIPPMPAIRFPTGPGTAEPTASATVVQFSSPEPAPPPDHERPLSLHPVQAEPPVRPQPEPELELRLPPGERPRRPQPRRLPFLVAAGFVLGVGLGTAGGWGAAVLLHEPEAVAAQPPALQLETAAAVPPTPTPAPVAAEPAPETPPDPAAEPVAPEAAEPAEAVAEAQELPPPPPVPTEAPARQAQPDRACATAPTAADRTICGDSRLRRLQAELRQAYNEALQAHEDRDLLRQRQLAWRDARNAVSDPDRLAALYEARIRKLNAATAEARALR